MIQGRTPAVLESHVQVPLAAGAVGECWFGLHDATTVQRSRIRAATFSLGSICLGSLVIATLTPHSSGCCVASSAVHSIIINTHAEPMTPDVAPAHHKKELKF